MAHTTREGIGVRARVPEGWERMLLIFSVTAAGLLPAQTTIDLHSQARNVDFTNAAATKVWKTGAALPASCNVGEGFFLTGATPGQNLYLCSASGVWTPSGPPAAGMGSTIQSVGGTFPPNAVPAIDSTSTQVSSGCTAALGSMTCAGGFNGGTGASRITATEGPAPSSPGSGQQTIYVDSADHNLKSVDSGNSVRQYATLSGTETLSAKTLTNPSLGASALVSEISNEGTVGTTVDRLAKLTGNPSAAIVTSASDTGGVIGVVTGGAGTTGTARIAIAGQATCSFDGATAAGDYVVASSAIGGACHDAGAAYPLAGQVLGRTLSTNAAGGAYTVELFGPEIRGGSNAPAGSAFDPLDETVAYWRDDMTSNTQWYIFTSNGGGLSFGNPDANHPGVFELSTGAAANSSVYMLFAWTNGTQVMHYPSGVWDMRWVVQPGSLAGAAYSFGFSDSGNNNSLLLTYDPTLGADWYGVSRNSGLNTSVDTGVPAATGAWAKLRMRCDGTNVYFSVNGSTEVTVPVSGLGLNAATGVSLYGSVTATGSVAENVSVDFFALQIQGLIR